MANSVRVPPPGTPVLMVDSQGRLVNRMSRDWYKFFLDFASAITGGNGASIENPYLNLTGEPAETEAELPPFAFEPAGWVESEDAAMPQQLLADSSELEARIDAIEAIAYAAAPTPEEQAESGTYTPTLTNVANLDASTARKATWVRIGATVSVSGQVDVDPTTTATPATLGISLPIPSALTTAYQLGGTACAMAIAGQSAGIQADTTNDRASMTWIAVDVTNQTMSYIFQYEVV